MSVRPQFPFGHGLSYARVRLANLRAGSPTFSPGEDVAASVEVVNEGASEGEATIFLFVRDVVASVSRPLLELKGVVRTRQAAGERGVVALRFPAAAFAFPDADFQPAIEPGRFELSVGLSADRAGLLSVGVVAVG